MSVHVHSYLLVTLALILAAFVVQRPFNREYGWRRRLVSDTETHDTETPKRTRALQEAVTTSPGASAPQPKALVGVPTDPPPIPIEGEQDGDR